MTSEITINVYEPCREGRCDDCIEQDRDPATRPPELAPQCGHECHGGSWDICRRCGKEYELYADGYDGMCPSCADATEPWTPERLGFDDPDAIGDSQYRAIYDCIADALADFDDMLVEGRAVALVAVMLDEFIAHATALKAKLPAGQGDT